MIVGGVCLSAFDVIGNEFDVDGRDVCVVEFVDECVNVDGVKSFCHIKRCCDCA